MEGKRSSMAYTESTDNACTVGMPQNTLLARLALVRQAASKRKVNDQTWPTPTPGTTHARRQCHGTRYRHTWHRCGQRKANAWYSMKHCRHRIHGQRMHDGNVTQQAIGTPEIVMDTGRQTRSKRVVIGQADP